MDEKKNDSISNFFQQEECRVVIDSDNELILAHEIGHAVELFISKLDGQCQGGALKESLADFLGISYMFNETSCLNWNILKERSFDNPSKIPGGKDCIDDFNFRCNEDPKKFEKHLNSGIFSKGLFKWINKQMDLKQDNNNKKKTEFKLLAKYVISATRGFAQQRHDFDNALEWLTNKSQKKMKGLFQDTIKKLHDAFKSTGIIADCLNGWYKCVIYVVKKREDNNTTVARKTICLKNFEENLTYNQARSFCEKDGKAFLYPLGEELSRCLNARDDLFQNDGKKSIEMWIGRCNRTDSTINVDIKYIKNASDICQNPDNKNAQLVLKRDDDGTWFADVEEDKDAKKPFLCRIRTCDGLE